MAQEKPDHEPKLSEVDIILVSVPLAVLDAADWFLGGLPATDLGAFPGLQAYMYAKGIGGGFIFVANTLELIPLVDYLPIRLSAFLAVAWSDRHPESKLAEIIAKGGEIRGGVKQKSMSTPGKKILIDFNKLASNRLSSSSPSSTPSPDAEAEPGKRSRFSRRSRHARRPGEESDEDPDKLDDTDKKELSLEEQELEDILSGNYIGRLIRETTEMEAILRQIQRESGEIKSPGQRFSNRYNKEIDLSQPS